MSKDIKVDEASYILLLNKALKNKEEERDMALDRYRKADESMQTNEHFMLLGKNAASFLSLAASSTNDIIGLMKEIGKVVYKESDNNNGGGSRTDEEMRAIIDLVKQQEAEDSATNQQDQIDNNATEEDK